MITLSLVKKVVICESKALCEAARLVSSERLGGAVGIIKRSFD